MSTNGTNGNGHGMTDEVKKLVGVLEFATAARAEAVKQLAKIDKEIDTIKADMVMALGIVTTVPAVALPSRHESIRAALQAGHARARAIARAARVPVGSVSWYLNDLIKQGKATRVDRGVYAPL